jgi:hypothetical protein
MSLIQAIIRVDYSHKDPLISVDYGSGKSRVPPQYLSISQTARRCFESGAIHTLQNQLKKAMPDIDFQVVHVLRLPGAFSEQPDLT